MSLKDLSRPFAFVTCLVFLGFAGLMPAAAQDGVLRDGAILDSIETPYGTVYKIHSTPQRKISVGTGAPSFDGDSYSFENQLGALIKDLFHCFSEHTSNTNDNTALFDGLSELLDPYIDGTQPLVFEFESLNEETNENNTFINSFFKTGDDLFPEGFEDPETGTPLDSACVEIGIDDTLDSDIPSQVTSATLGMDNAMGTVIPPIDITGLLNDPFDGRISIVFTNLVGQDINSVSLSLTTQPDPMEIFADGFESGDATSWTDQVP